MSCAEGGPNDGLAGACCRKVCCTLTSELHVQFRAVEPLIHILHSPEDFATARALIANGEDVTQNKPSFLKNHSRDVTPTQTQTQAERKERERETETEREIERSEIDGERERARDTEMMSTHYCRLFSTRKKLTVIKPTFSTLECP